MGFLPLYGRVPHLCSRIRAMCTLLAERRYVGREPVPKRCGPGWLYNPPLMEKSVGKIAAAICHHFDHLGRTRDFGRIVTDRISS